MNTQRPMGRMAGAALLLLAGALPAGAQQADLALVKGLLLNREAVLTAAGGAPRAATLGDRLGNQDAIVTSENTRAAITFIDDGSLVRLNPSSQLVVTAQGDPGSMVKTVEMDFGELWARVTRGEERSFQVQTPAGVAAVKGTDFIVRVGADGTTTVITLEGVVEFFNQGGTADVSQGNTVVVATPNTPPVPRSTTPEDLMGVEGLLEDDTVPADEDTVEVEVTVQDADGRSRTLVMRLPRAEARAILGGGN